MQPTNITITIATVNDAAALRSLSVKTFYDTFSKDNRKEDMDKYITEDMSLVQITEELEDKNNVFFLAYNSGVLTGYAKVRGTKTPEELKSKNALEIERIYVLQEHHGTKTGAALMKRCIDHALSKECDVIWLGVWEQNYKAVNFYKRWGFELFGSHPFLLGNDLQTDMMMKKEL